MPIKQETAHVEPSPVCYEKGGAWFSRSTSRHGREEVHRIPVPELCPRIDPDAVDSDQTAARRDLQACPNASPVFPGRADDHHAAAQGLAVGGIQRLLQRLLGLGDLHTPEFGGVMEAELSVFDLHPGRLFAFAPNDQRVQPRLFQIVPEVSPAVGGGRDPCQRGEG